VHCCGRVLQLAPVCEFVVRTVQQSFFVVLASWSQLHACACFGLSYLWDWQAGWVDLRWSAGMRSHCGQTSNSTRSEAVLGAGAKASLAGRVLPPACVGCTFGRPAGQGLALDGKAEFGQTCPSLSRVSSRYLLRNRLPVLGARFEVRTGLALPDSPVC
jgi:hypothetical protein